MLPIQLLVQNLLYDLSQIAITFDHVDPEHLRVPRDWDHRGLRRFMLYIGPISSLFDATTFLLLWFVFGANDPSWRILFHSGWFLEGLLTQTLVVHLIRTQKKPFLEARPAALLLWSTVAAVAVGVLPWL